MEDLLKNLGQRIRELRERKNLSRVELGKAAGTTHVTIGSIEEGLTATNVALLQRIATALGSQAWKLLKPKEKDLSVVPLDGLSDLVEDLEKLAQGDALQLIKGFQIAVDAFLGKASLELRHSAKRSPKRGKD